MQETFIMSFRIHALDPALFAPLFSLSDDELKARNAIRVTATHKPGFPCRVSLADAEIGEELLLLHHEHQPADTPFKASHAIYIRKDATQALPGADEVPELLRLRTLSLRAYNRDHMLIAADLAEGANVEETIDRLLLNPEAAYLHLHNAQMGCYFAHVERV